MIIPYTKAYSPMYWVDVEITHQYQDVDGRWLFYGENPDEWNSYIIFREEELENLH